MSFGDPNNPYGNPPGQQPGQPPQQPQGQPGYGYPQGAPQGVPPQHGAPQGQPGYGYPQAAPQGVPPQQGVPQGQPGYGYPQAPPAPQGYGGGQMEMPGLMKTARVLLFVLAGFQLLAGIIFGILIGAVQDVSSGVGTGAETGGLAALGIGAALLMLALGALSIFLGVKFKTGGSGIRISTIVYAALMILGSIFNIVNGGTGSATFGGLISLAWAGIILAAMVNSAASTWFDRPRH